MAHEVEKRTRFLSFKIPWRWNLELESNSQVTLNLKAECTNESNYANEQLHREEACGGTT